MTVQSDASFLPEAPDGYEIPTRVLNKRGVQQTYVVTGWFPVGASDHSIEYLHRAPALVFDFDLVDWLLFLQGEEAIDAKAMKDFLYDLEDEALDGLIQGEFLPLILSQLSSVGLSPTYVTYSGYGCHAVVWVLEDQGYGDVSPFDFNKLRSCNKQLVNSINKGVGFNFADPKVHDAGTRLLRSPGSWNRKNPDRPRMVKVIYKNPESRIDLTSLAGTPSTSAKRKKPQDRTPPPPSSSPPPPGPTTAPSDGEYENETVDFLDIPFPGYPSLYHKMMTMDPGERENIVCPFGGTSRGSAFIRVPEGSETWSDRFRMTSNVTRINYYNKSGFADVDVTLMLGVPVPRVDYANIVRILREDIYAPDLRWDERGLCGTINGKRAGDKEIREEIICWINTRYERHPCKDAAFDAFNDVVQDDRFDPVAECLESLSWDGEERLDYWLTVHCGAEDMDGLSKIYARKFLIAAVARALSPGCKMDTMLVFVDPKQGNGKTQLIEILAGTEYYGVGQVKPGDRDFMTQLQRTWFWEWGELSRLRHSDIEALKDFMSKTFNSWVPKYVRTEVLFPRRAVFMGTTNKPEVLHDSTGSRRFWVIHTKEIDLNWFKENRDQLFAEAVVAYKAGEIWHLTPDEDKTRDAASVEFKEEDPLEVRAWSFALVHPMGFKMVQLFDALDIRVESYGKMRVQLRDTLTALGLRYKQIRLKDGTSKRDKIWIHDDLYAAAQKAGGDPDNVYEYKPKPKAGSFDVDL